MERIDALKQLAAKVEAGEAPKFSMFNSGFCLWKAALPHVGTQRLASDAYHGSLDAAKALMKAALPEWSWRVSEAYGPNTVAHRTFWVSRPESWRSGHTADALKHGDARAGLLAILRALISMEEAK